MNFEKYQPTIVIHLPATVGGLFNNMQEKVKMFTENFNLNTLSTWIFADAIVYPFDETMLHIDPPHPSNEGYAYANRMLEVLTFF